MTHKSFFSVNAHGGLFCYMRLLFGFACFDTFSAKKMDAIFQGIDGIIRYLACGKTEAGHLDNNVKFSSCDISWHWSKACQEAFKKVKLCH